MDFGPESGPEGLCLGGGRGVGGFKPHHGDIRQWARIGCTRGEHDYDCSGVTSCAVTRPTLPRAPAARQAHCACRKPKGNRVLPPRGLHKIISY